jgi:epoxyqueuosine reductase
MPTISFQTLSEFAAHEGLAIVGVSTPDGLGADRERLEAWQSAGYAGEMSFMQRESELLAGPARLLDGVRTIVSVGAYYDRGPRAPLRSGYGRVARYAWGRDYHKVLRKRLESLARAISDHLGGALVYRVFSDSVPLLERAVARQAGLGFIGKNTMLIIPRAGSYLFLGEILWNLEVADLPSLHSEVRGSCGSCSRCIDSCPTGAFVSERVLDARRCISYLTIEKRGALSWIEREWLGEWLFGCDVCQDVCPFNVLPLKKRLSPAWEEFSPEAGSGQLLSLAELLSIRQNDDFVARFGGTPIMRTKREGLLRNACVVAANTASFHLVPILRDAFLSDASAVVRQHALWSVVKLGCVEGTQYRDEATSLIQRAFSDPEQVVREEARACEKLLV